MFLPSAEIQIANLQVYGTNEIQTLSWFYLVILLNCPAVSSISLIEKMEI